MIDRIDQLIRVLRLTGLVVLSGLDSVSYLLTE